MTQNDMSELIRRKDVIKAMGDIHPMDYNTISLLERIQQIPAVDAEPVRHGKWIENEGFDGDCYYTCSVCHCDWTTIDGTPTENNMRYCPECGAKMDLEG